MHYVNKKKEEIRIQGINKEEEGRELWKTVKSNERR